MLIAQGFDGIFKGIGDALDAFAAAFAFLLFLAAVAMLVAALAGTASILWLAVHAVTTTVRLSKKKYREKGPGLLSVLMSLPGIVIPATALIVMLNDGPGSNDGIPLIVFLFSTGALLFVWFAPWAQHVKRDQPGWERDRRTGAGAGHLPKQRPVSPDDWCATSIGQLGDRGCPIPGALNDRPH